MDPILMQIGPVTLRWYGMMIATACFIGLWLAKKEAVRKQIKVDEIEGFFFFAFLIAIAGARFYYVAFSDPSLFWKDPLWVLSIWNGGLAIHGAILGGFFEDLFYTKAKNISFWKFADTLAPSLILGQAIGRIGCFFNGDAHGYPTNMPWGIIYSPDSPAGQMYPGQALHPTQLYEMGLNLIVFAVLWSIRKKINIDSKLFLIYVISYSFARFIVEIFRADKLTYLGSISAAQSISVVGIILAIIFMTFLHTKGRNVLSTN